jgi:DNA-binding PadR family transcriptional regulator
MSDNKVLDNILQELKRGTLVMIVLLNLKEKEYGYSLISKLQEAGIDIEQNTLYPLLRRLEKQGLLESLWDTTESRPRKYYIISEEGRLVLGSILEEWKRTSGVVEGMLE